MGSSDSDVVKTSRASTIPNNMKAVAVFVVAALLVVVASARPQQQELEADQLALRSLAEDLAEDASEDVNADVAATDRRFDYAGLCKWCIKMGIQIGHPECKRVACAGL